MIDLNKINEVPFVEKVIFPESMPDNPDIYLGIGFRGSDGNKGCGFGLDLLFFLKMADDVRRMTGIVTGTIFLMDRPFPENKIIDVTCEAKALRKILESIKAEDSWRLVKYSEVFGDVTLGSCYEEIQSRITAMLLEKGGFQIGWVYPFFRTNFLAKDEHYFSRHFREGYFPERKDVGFVFGRFPSILPSYTPGAPYLVKSNAKEKRLLLVEEEDNLRRKLTLPKGGMLKLRRNKMNRVFDVFRHMGISMNGDPPTETFIHCMKQLGEMMGEDYRQAF